MKAIPHRRVMQQSQHFLHFLWIAIIGLLLVVVLVACGNPIDSATPVLAQDLCMFAHSPELQLGTTDAVGVAKWVKATYGVEPEQMVKTEGDLSIVEFFWKQNNHHWSATVRDRRLARVSKFDLDNGPTLGQVVTLWGEPEFVYGYIGTICEKSCSYSLGLDYPRLGLSISRSGLETAQELRKTGTAALSVRRSLRATEVHCYQPGPMEEVLTNAFGASVDSVTAQMLLRSSWSGFDALVPLGPR